MSRVDESDTCQIATDEERVEMTSMETEGDFDAQPGKTLRK